MTDQPYVRISGTDVIITKGRSPLADVIERIHCQTEASAQKTMNHIMKQLGYTYGGQQ